MKLKGDAETSGHKTLRIIWPEELEMLCAGAMTQICQLQHMATEQGGENP